MALKLSEFNRTKEFLICIDSDGCVMDTMNSKHIYCFGPCLLTVWDLDSCRDQVLKRWNEINLYTMTRGINRFKGLAILLSEADQYGKHIPGIREFCQWTESAKELSNDGVEAEWRRTGLPIFQQALDWSKEVNRRIASLPEEKKKTFPRVSQGLEAASRLGDVAVVSSANRPAVVAEWEKQGLLAFTSVILAQEDGSKNTAISTLLGTGYDKEKCLMVGDSPGDCQAALDNGIFYYPILAGQESASWEQLVKEAFPRLKDGTYQGRYQENVIDTFMKNLHAPGI